MDRPEPIEDPVHSEQEHSEQELEQAPEPEPETQRLAREAAEALARGDGVAAQELANAARSHQTLERVQAVLDSGIPPQGPFGASIVAPKR